MSHGNVTTHIGTCDVCGRKFVDLRKQARLFDPPFFRCVDEFACFAAWRAQEVPA